MGTTFTDFRTTDFTGASALSTYALSTTPLLFVPAFNLFEDKKNRVVWDFGDGTISRSTSAYKSYKYPGKYIVQMILYDCFNNALQSTYQKPITILDYKPLTFDLDVYSKYDVFGNELTALSANLNTITFKNGQISGPFVFTVSYPYYQSPLNIYYTVSGSDSENYWGLTDKKFVHLDNTYNFYDTIYNYSISSYQYRPVAKIVPETTKIFSKIKDGEIIPCSENEPGAFFVGLTGIKQVYFKEDLPKRELNLSFRYDKRKYDGDNIDYIVNNLGITLSANVLANEPYSLSITSNGIDGEGYPISSFNINPIKLYDTKIPFVVKVKDLSSFSIKNFEYLELSALNISLSAVDGSGIPLSGISTTEYTISSLNTTLSAQTYNGAFRGYVEFTNASATNITENVVIYANTTLTTDTSSYFLSAKSTPFSVYPDNNYEMYKINEDFDAAKTLRDITFQELIAENDDLYDDFFAGVLGDNTSDHDGIGLKLYEHIANFVDNTSDLDRCGIDQLESLCQNIGYVDKNEEKYKYPESIKRLVDLLSIDKNRLFGTSNKFKDNFDTKGLTTKSKFGRNLGSEINDTSSYIVSAGNDIVALEKFSNTYTRLNSYQPVSAVSAFNYPLSSYTSDWGWPLVLPGSFDFGEIEKYYLFFEINEEYDNTILDVVIDFYNTRTTVLSTTSKNDLIRDGGIFDNMFINTLYKSLSLVD